MAAVGDGTQAVLAPASGWAILVLSMSAIRSGMAHIPLPICALSAQAAGQADIDVLPLIGLEPAGLLDVVLARNRAGFHRGVDLIAGAIEKAGVDEDHALPRGADAFHEIDARAALFVHDAHLQRVARQPSSSSTAANSSLGKCHLFGSVHLWFDDVDRSCARIAHAAPAAAQIVERDQRRHHRSMKVSGTG